MEQKENKEIIEQLTDIVQESGISINIINMCDDTPLKEFCKDTVNDFFEQLYEKIRESQEITNYEYNLIIDNINILYKNPALNASEELNYDEINKKIDESSKLVLGNDIFSYLICTMYKAKIRSYIEKRSVSNDEFGSPPPF